MSGLSVLPPVYDTSDESCIPVLTPLSTSSYPDFSEYYVPFGVDVHPEGTVLALSAHRRITLLETGEFTVLKSIPLTDEHIRGVETLAWSSDGKYLAVYGGPTFGIALLEPDSGEVLSVFATNDAYTSTITASLIWSPDDLRLALMGNYMPLRIWDTATGNILLEYGEKQLFYPDPENRQGIINNFTNLQMVSWSPEGTYLALVDNEAIIIFEMQDWSIINRLTSAKSDTSGETVFVSVEWLDESRLVATNSIGQVNFWQRQEEQSYETFDDRPIWITKISPDRQYLALGSLGVMILDAATLEPLTPFIAAELYLKSGMFGLDWIKDDRIIIYDGSFGSLATVNLNTGGVQSLGHINCVPLASD